MESELFEKRIFSRYKSAAECLIQLGADTYKGKVDNYSASGICVNTETDIIFRQGMQVKIDIPDLEMNFNCNVMWAKDLGSGCKVGFMRVGNIEGPLKYIHLADILIGLQRSTRTGVLEISSSSATRKVFIENGDMIFSASDKEDERLGEFLLKKGRLSIEQFQQASTLLQKEKQKMGKILVESGYFTPTELFQEVRQQTEEIILNLFTIESDRFEFNEQVLEPEVIKINMTAANIIYKGIKRINSFVYLNKIYPPIEVVLNFSSDPLDLFQSITLTDPDKKILSYVNGIHSIKTILALSPLSDFETLKTICAFLKIGLVRIRQESEAPVVLPPNAILGDSVKDLPEQFIKEMDEMYTKCTTLGYYEILNIAKEATMEEIKSAYYNLTKKFHPDLHFSMLSHNIKGKLLSIFSYTTNAYETLSDKDKRLEYDSKLQDPSKSDGLAVASNEDDIKSEMIESKIKIEELKQWQPYPTNPSRRPSKG
jgi:hypothetical protein